MIQRYIIRWSLLTALIVPNLYAQITASNPWIQQMVNAVSRDSLLKSVQQLQAFVTRYEYTSQRDSAASFILNKFLSWGVQAESDWYMLGLSTLYDLDMIDKDTIWIAGSNGAILNTVDGGTTWEVKQSPTSGSCIGIDFIDGKTGWIVGPIDTIVHTTDGGAHWTLQSIPVTSYLYDVSFINENLGIAVGVSGVILRTTNGGITWSAVTSNTTYTLREVTLADTLNGWIVGDNGKVLCTTDGGESWNPQTSNVSLTLFSVYFINSQHGWAVGDGPTIIKTTDGGTTWTSITCSPSLAQVLRGVCFVDTMHGWAIDYYGSVLKTTDGGETWTQSYKYISTDGAPYFRKIKVIESQRVTFCGTLTTVVSSTDDGNTWIDQTANLPSTLFHQSRNIVATIPGTITPEKECVMVAHYDSYSSNAYVAAPGANDNGTGTAAVLEAARICRNYQFESTVKLIAVSAEELGLYGSEHYARTAKSQGRIIEGAVNGDMIGYPTSGDTTRLVIGSFLTRNRLVDSAVVYNQRYAIGANLVEVVDLYGASDHGPFTLAGYDALDVAEATTSEIWGGMDPFYHTPQDSSDRLNFGLVQCASRLMLATVAEMAMPTNEIVTVKTASTVPEYFNLSQNYPNPFNPTTTIGFEIKDRGFITLKVFDMLGREVSSLVNKELEPGSYSVPFNAGKLSSGVYFYRLNSGRSFATRRMLLLK